MIRLRPVTRGDVPALAALTHRCDATHHEWAGERARVPTIAEQELGWHERLVRAGSWAVAAVDEDDRIVGACAFSPAREHRDHGAYLPGLAHVSAVFVDPAHWRRGIARLLLDAADAAMAERGFERARLWTLESSPAERLYAATGWVRTDERDHHPPTDLPIVQYVKRLAAPEALSRPA